METKFQTNVHYSRAVETVACPVQPAAELDPTSSSNPPGSSGLGDRLKGPKRDTVEEVLRSGRYFYVCFDSGFLEFGFELTVHYCHICSCFEPIITSSAIDRTTTALVNTLMYSLHFLYSIIVRAGK